ncbi:MAG: hypothetical protein V9G04_14245 [Nocardioides sp.]
MRSGSTPRVSTPLASWVRPLAGLLIAAFGGGAAATGWVILLNAATYAAPIWALRHSRHATAATRPEPPPRGKGLIREGFAYIASRPDLVLVLLIVFVVGTFGLNFQMTSALMATEVFGKVGPTAYGLLGTFDGVRFPRRCLGGCAPRDRTPAVGGRGRAGLRRRGDRRRADAVVPDVRADRARCSDSPP